TVKRMLGHLSTLLEGIASEPSQRVSSLPLLSATEVDSLLGSSAGVSCFTEESSLLPLLAEQVKNTPQATAVRSESGAVTYAELDRNSNLLGQVLLAVGVTPESIVAVLSERSTDLLLAMRGSFKAAAAYLPLDPLQPARRLRQVLEAAGVRVVLVA